MALSKDPKKRARQLANRRNGPPAPRGNSRALHHGANASKANLVGIPEARQDLYDAIAASAPVRAQNGSLPAADATLVELAATTLARYRQVNVWLDEHGLFDRKGLRPVVMQLTKIESRLTALLIELGMTPKSRAALGVDLARTVDLSIALSEKDPEKRRAMLAEAGLPVDGAADEGSDRDD